VSSVRTILGDIAPDQLGVCYAHEHIIIDDNVATLRFPDFRLPSVENGIAELALFHAEGGRAMVDSMPCDAGRNVLKLAEISRASQVHILCPTGLHLAKYYDDGHWSHHYGVETLAGLFIADIEEGIDRHDYSGPCVERTPHRAGLIKIATGGVDVSARDRRVFEAAAIAHLKTGAPILTHVEAGRGAMEQVELLSAHGVDLSKVVLSHTDRTPDAAYHRDFLQSGVYAEYDSAFRWKTGGNPTLELLAALIEEFPTQLMLGMDAARPSYWTSYGGSPGHGFLLNEFTRAMAARGIGDERWKQIFISNPASAYQFKKRS
jgi:predicted metal-dependent phosphotriesterase family hydrolase